MVKESDEELIKDTPITLSKLLEKPKGEIKWEQFKPYKSKSNQFHGDGEE